MRQLEPQIVLSHSQEQLVKEMILCDDDTPHISMALMKAYWLKMETLNTCHWSFHLYVIIFFQNNTNNKLHQNVKQSIPEDFYPDTKINKNISNENMYKGTFINNSFPNKMPSVSNAQFTLDINRSFTFFRCNSPKILLSPTAEHISPFLFAWMVKNYLILAF